MAAAGLEMGRVRTTAAVGTVAREYKVKMGRRVGRVCGGGGGLGKKRAPEGE